MPAPQASQGGSDHSGGILWGTAATFFLLGMIWFAFKKQIIYVYLSIKLFEVNMLSLISESHFEQTRASLLSALANPAAVPFSFVVSIGNAAGDWLRFPFVIILFALAVLVYVGNTARFFRTTYNMRNLMQMEKTNWPQIHAVANLDLLKQDIDVGPWAMALSPMQFCKRYKLLEEVRPERREGMSRKDWDKVEVILKRGEANKVFALQLGPLWRGTEHLPPHVRALFAVFAARINSDTDAALALIKQLSSSAASETKKLDLTGVDELIKKHENTKLVQKIVQSHAYVLTVMASMLQGARDDGVQSSSDFIWLKPLDRRLWYVLNTVGRQTPFAEVGGIFAHWIAEKEGGRKFLVPMVEEATNALDLALKEVVYRPDEA